MSKPKTVDEHLDMVSLKDLENNKKYVPSLFALNFATTIELINGGDGESHKTPTMHLAMLDKLCTRHQRVVNLCFRGASKTTLFFNYLVLYIAIYGGIPGFKDDISGILYVSDSIENGVRTARKSLEFQYDNSPFLKEQLPQAKFTETEITFTNSLGKQTGIRLFGAKSGIRGVKIFNKRPVLAILDDLVSDSDSRSKLAMDDIKATVFSGVWYALDPVNRKMVMNATPFTKQDIAYEAIESGAWEVNVWPVAEKFPCSKEEFSGAWPDRFSFETISEQYRLAELEGKLKNFRQEMMLRITSEESKLVKENEILWVPEPDRKNVNYYITTDFATSSKQTADFNVISVWAYDTHNCWTLVDVSLKKQTMDTTVEEIFTLVDKYRPQSVAMEVTGQQGGFVSWFQKEMNYRNKFFNILKVRPVSDKLSRFSLVVPLFKQGKIKFSESLKGKTSMDHALMQLDMATEDGFKSKDDFIDTVSMLQYLRPWSPSVEEVTKTEKQVRPMWGPDETTISDLGHDGISLSSYIV